MKQYIAIIRGINVGGHNRVNMKLLREILEKKKFKQVQTYIQSGNIVFASAETSAEKLESELSDLLLKGFNVKVPVIVRDSSEWARTVSRNPFLNETEDHTKLLVTFLNKKPAADDVKAVNKMKFAHDEFAFVGKDIYIFCKEGYGKTDIPNMFFEKQLKVTGTTRNWRSVLAISELVKS
jgi:uncharacterized protein (DUF1697 family)